jgi:hypothetical protein
LPFFFALTLLVSATLLFLIQPMVAKMILPLLGGTPAVWNTCMVFFQAALLAGYAYAHVAPKWLGRRRQMLFHLCLFLAPVAVLPIAVSLDWLPPSDDNPIPWLFGLLLVSVGLPFLVVATSAPLLQQWFVHTGHPSAKDPYFLYGASNIGSMLALLGYPTLVEPFFPLADQTLYWALGYGVLNLLTIGCVAFAWKRPHGAELPRLSSNADRTEEPAPDQRSALSATRLRWIALAFVPSSLMLGVTSYFTTDIAAIPLLWVVPLAIYLLSFIIVFAKRPWLAHETMVRALPPTVLCLVFLMIGGGTHQMQTAIVMLVHLVALFVVAMVCHGELARLRPPAEHLTSFYLCMSLGGVLGGMFNALLAPLVFTRVVEYPLALICGCLLMPRAKASDAGLVKRCLDLVLPALLGLIAAGLILGLAAGPDSASKAIPFLRDLPPALSAMLVYLVPLVLCFTFAGRPVRFGLGVGAILLASALCQDPQGNVIHRERGFFGDLHIRYDSSGKYIQMVHGTTLHGMQSLNPAERGEPLTYFHKTGPIGQLFSTLQGPDQPRQVAVTGLGVGTLLSYAKPGQSWTYYEIDPAVYRVANDPAYFTYLKDATERGVNWRVILGDARLKMQQAKQGQYDLIILDAFSSDSVPVHLLTREALTLYLSKLTERGRLVFNISNRYLRLEPVLAALADDAGLVGLVHHDERIDGAAGKNASSWVVMARHADVLGELAQTPGWRPLERQAGVELWTDDFSNILRIFMWRN